jgi:hypothetical protein
MFAKGLVGDLGPTPAQRLAHLRLRMVCAQSPDQFRLINQRRWHETLCRFVGGTGRRNFRVSA